jgi:hypothetical protein
MVFPLTVTKLYHEKTPSRPSSSAFIIYPEGKIVV